MLSSAVTHSPTRTRRCSSSAARPIKSITCSTSSASRLATLHRALRCHHSMALLPRLRSPQHRQQLRSPRLAIRTGQVVMRSHSVGIFVKFKKFGFFSSRSSNSSSARPIGVEPVLQPATGRICCRSCCSSTRLWNGRFPTLPNCARLAGATATPPANAGREHGTGAASNVNGKCGERWRDGDKYGL